MVDGRRERRGAQSWEQRKIKLDLGLSSVLSCGSYEGLMGGMTGNFPSLTYSPETEERKRWNRRTRERGAVTGADSVLTSKEPEMAFAGMQEAAFVLMLREGAAETNAVVRGLGEKKNKHTNGIAQLPFRLKCCFWPPARSVTRSTAVKAAWQNNKRGVWQLWAAVTQMDKPS